jgi:steroid delta-isomerase
MEQEHVTAWARAWIDGWNARDVEGLLTHYRDDVRFESPVAETVTGSPLVEGKDALRRYWTAALDRMDGLQFDLERVIWDAARHELAIVYVARLQGRRRRACELVVFDAAGQVIRGEACYGAGEKAFLGAP